MPRPRSSRDAKAPTAGDGFLFKYPDTVPLFVGLDLSLCCSGVTVLWPDGDGFKHDTFTIKPPDKVVGPARLRWNLDKLNGWLSELRGKDVRSVALEDYAMGIRGGRLASLGEWGGIVRLALHDEGWALVSVTVSPTSLKKFTTSAHLAEKAAMMVSIYKRWGVEFSDSDSADSFALAMYALAKASEKLFAETTGEPLQGFQRATLASASPLQPSPARKAKAV
jgi:Holliday junction resolvasome RuvABC endonuclease subunit